MKLSAILAPLLDAKADHEMIRRTIVAYEAEQNDALTRRRESDAKRQAEKRERDKGHVTSRDVTVTVSSHAGAARVEDNLQTKNQDEKKEEKKDHSAPAARLAEFRAELSSILDPERIEALVAVRRKKGATFSALAGKLLFRALSACPDINEAADEMVLRNWTGVKPDWLESRQRSQAPPRQQESYLDAFDTLQQQGFFPDEQISGASHNGHAQRISAEPDPEQTGRVVDLRPGIVRRLGSGDH